MIEVAVVMTMTVVEGTAVRGTPLDLSSFRFLSLSLSLSLYSLFSYF
jgi:hypothetical protein